MISSAEISRPTWFVTLSSADMYWPELWIAIEALNGNVLSLENAAKLTFQERVNLLDANPVLAARMFKSRVDLMLNEIFRGKAHPIGFLVDWWFRVEFQRNGSLHIHSIIWAWLFAYGKWFESDELHEMMSHKNNKPNETETESKTSKNEEKKPIDKHSIFQNDSDIDADVASTISSNNESLENDKESNIKKDFPKYGRKELAEIVSNYMSAHIPDIEHNLLSVSADSDAGVQMNSIAKDSQDHASLRQKFIGKNSDYNINDHQEQTDLVDCLASFQMHDKNHRSSCRPKNQPKKKIGNPLVQICRFNFPRKLQLHAVIKSVRFPGQKKYKLQALPKRNNFWVNNYNPWLTLNYRANTDIQLIVIAISVAMYCCLYSSKAEAPDQNILNKNMMKVLIASEKMESEKQTRRTMFLAANALYTSREISAQECVWTLLGNPFHWSSRQTIRVNLLPPHKKFRSLKNKSELAKLGPDSSDIFMKADSDLIEKSLQIFMSLKNTPKQLADLSYYDFIVHFKETKAKSAKKIAMSSNHLTNGDSFFIRREKTALFLSMPQMKSDVNDLYTAWGLLIAHHKHFTVETFKSWEFDDSVEILQREIAAKNMSSSLNKVMQKLQLHDKMLDQTKGKKTNDFNDSESSHSSNNDDKSVSSNNDYDFENDAAPDDEDCNDVPPAQSLSTMDGYKNTSKVDYQEFKQAIDFIKFANLQQQADSQAKLKKFDKTTTTDSPHFDELNCPTTNETSFYMKYENLGIDQKEAFDVIAAHLLEQSCVKSETNPDGQLRMIVSGAAGTGKSKLIRAVVFYTRMQFGYGNTKHGPVLVVTVMGIAAFNAKGETMDRSCFVWQFGENSEHDHNMIKKIQDSLSGILLLIIDEMGTLGLYKFGKLNRIFQIARNDFTKPFGGIHVIICGDYFQIPPVRAQALFHSVKFSDKNYSESGFECYRSFNCYKELTFNFRQQGTSDNEKLFVDCLL